MARCARLPLSGCAIGHTFGVRVQRVQKVQRIQRGVVSPSRAMLMKSALRINLSASYVMKSILVISRCAAHPYPAAPDFLHGKACHTILRSLCSLTARLSPTHNILCVTAFLHPLLSLTHWIFGSLMLPYKSSSHSAKYVRWCDSCPLATPSGGQNKSLYVFL